MINLLKNLPLFFVNLDKKNKDVVLAGDFKGKEHVPNIFMSLDKYLFLEVINILI